MKKNSIAAEMIRALNVITNEYKQGNRPMIGDSNSTRGFIYIREQIRKQEYSLSLIKEMYELVFATEKSFSKRLGVFTEHLNAFIEKTPCFLEEMTYSFEEQEWDEWDFDYELYFHDKCTNIIMNNLNAYSMSGDGQNYTVKEYSRPLAEVENVIKYELVNTGAKNIKLTQGDSEIKISFEQRADYYDFIFAKLRLSAEKKALRFFHSDNTHCEAV